MTSTASAACAPSALLCATGARLCAPSSSRSASSSDDSDADAAVASTLACRPHSARSGGAPLQAGRALPASYTSRARAGW